MLRHLLFITLVLGACASPPGSPVGSSTASLSSPLTFDDWKARYLGADQVEREKLEARGIELAAQRREGFRALLLEEPQRAIELAVTPIERLALPASVSRFVEQWHDGLGTLHVIGAVGTPGTSPSLERFVTFSGNDEIFRAGVFGARLASETRENVRLHGVALDGAIALTDRRLRRLLPGEARPSLPMELPRACPVSRRAVEPALLFHGGDTLYGFCTAEHSDEYETTLALGEEQAAADSGLPPASSWTEGPKTVLYVRVDFSDRPGDPISLATAQTSIDTNTSDFYQANSYGKTSMSATVTPTLRLPRTQADYRTNDQYFLLRSDALGAARDAGFDSNNYSLDVVAFANTYSGWAGRGYVGSKGTWLNGDFSLRVTAHELGHNYGVNHANSWSATGLTVIGPGTNVEYGNPFDVMGAAGNTKTHFNAWFKRRFDWISAAEVATVTSSGTYRISELEMPVVTGLHALKVPRDSQKDYWVEYRPAINTAVTRDGVSINWGYPSNTGSHLLDMTPGDGTMSDSTLIIGRTFSDQLAGIHVTPIGKGGTTPQTVDVVVNVGAFPGNRPPTLAINASTQTPAVSQVVTFTATASDPDGDALAYAWDFGDGTWGANAATVTHAFGAARACNVRLVVSDMKGGTLSRAVLITVGAPTTFTLTGTALAGTTPIEGVRITDGTREAFTSADGTYALTEVPTGSFTVSAGKNEFTFARGFAAPLAVSASQGNLDFSATAVAGYALRGKITFGATNLAGATVSDGSRTATTNATGDYVLTGVPTGRYTLTAVKPGWELRAGFTNPVDVFGGDVNTLNFFANGQTLYGSIPTAGVTTAPVVTDGVRTVTANAGGASWTYYLSAVPSGSWNLVATSPGVTLTSGSFMNPVQVLGMSLGNLNFQVTTGASFLVEGTVRTGGTPLPNVSISDGTRVVKTDSIGHYVFAGVPAGTFTLTPTLTGYTFVPATLDVTVSTTNLTGKDFGTTMVNLPPTVVSASIATPSTVTGTSTTLAVLGADDTGEPALTYSWNAGGAFWPISFSANGTNAAKNAVATFSAAGTYTLECVITDPGGLSVRSSVVVQVQSVLTSLTLTPPSATVLTGAMKTFQVMQNDQFNRAMFFDTPAWSLSGGGTLTAPGSIATFTAAATPGGPYLLTATVGARVATSLITVAGLGTPTITAVATATPNPVAGLTTQLAVRASDDGGEAALVYRWVSTLAPAAVMFSSNDDNASKDVVATFSAAGDYEFQVTVIDGSGNTVTSTVSVTVQATPTSLDVQPRVVNLQAGQPQTFAATVSDQFGTPLAPQPAITWSVSAGGVVDGAGTFTAGAVPGGPHVLTASAGTVSASAQITIDATPDTTPPTVSVTEPLTGTRHHGSTALAAIAADDVGVVKVEFLADSAVIATITTTPWESTFDASSLTDGTHVLTARALDAAGNSTISDPVSIVVGTLDAAAPVVTVRSPIADANTGLMVDVSVNATDDVGVSEVKLELDGAIVATLGSTPWSRRLELAPGVHSLVAIGTDAAGNSGRSAAVSFTAAGPISEVTEPERVLGGCGCSSVEGPAFQLGLLLLGLALRSRRRSGRVDFRNSRAP